MIEKIKRIYRYYFKSQPKFKITHKAKIERHGSVYGGWDIISNSVQKESIVYSVGIGQDISFDLSLMSKYNCTIYGFDPTPRVVEWLAQQQISTSFRFYPIGLSDIDGQLTFYSPENEQHISHKAFAENSSKAVVVECQKLSSLMKKFGHEHIDLLKIDIEGFEYPVIDNILEEKIPIKQLLIEFHHFFPEIGNQKTEDAIAKLESYGYRLFNVSDSFCEYSFSYSK
jgi:FkbM family methyltransferase